MHVTNLRQIVRINVQMRSVDGKMNAVMTENLRDLKEIRRRMNTYDAIGQEYVRQQAVLERYKKAETTWAPKNKKKYMIISVAAGIIIFPLFAFGVAAAVGLHFFYDKIAENKTQLREKKEAEVSAILERYFEARKPVEDACRRLLLNRDDYETSMSVDYLIQMIETGRADTMREAYDKLDEQLHRWAMENMQKQQLEMQIAQNRRLQEISIMEAAQLGRNLFR